MGGETEALQRLKKFAAECQAQPPKGAAANDGIYGANFSCKISPWLAMGSLSPRAMYDEIKKSASRYALVYSSVCFSFLSFLNNVLVYKIVSLLQSQII